MLKSKLSSLLLFIFLPAITYCQLLVFGHTPTALETCTSPTARGEFIRDDFNGSSLSGNWTVASPGSQTITVSGGKCRIQGGLSTKNMNLNIQYSGQSYSMMRNYTVTIGFKFNSLTSTDFGPYCGVTPRANDNNLYSAYGNVDPANVDSVEIINTNGSNGIGLTTRTSSGLPAINTSDDYTLSFTMNEDTSSATLTNVTAGTSVTVKLPYIASVSVTPRRPTIFQYTMGVCGSSDISIDYFSVTTTESIHPKIIWVGDSITTGYAANDFLLCYPYYLRANTSCLIQVMAGAGLTSTDGYIDRNEVITMAPTIVCSMWGANDGGSVQTAYQLLVAALQAAGIQVYIFNIVNGGDPATPGTYNNTLAATFPGITIDIWTDGWSQMTIGNGRMVDALHATASGYSFLAGIIKSKLPTLFPL